MFFLTFRTFQVQVSFTLLFFLGVSSSVQARDAVQPNAELLRSQERDRVLQEQNAPDIDIHVPSEPTLEEGRLIPADESPCFEIKHIALTGERAQNFSWLLWYANSVDGGPKRDPAVPRCLGTRGIGVVMRRVQNALIQKGYITTRVLVGPQNLSSGVLTFTVVPGVVNALQLDPDAQGKVTVHNAFPIRSGDLLNLRDIEQGLENMKRLPSVETDIKITPVQEDGKTTSDFVGQSDLFIKWRKKSPVRVTVGVDNSGVSSTGIYQGNVTLFLDNPLKINDLFYITYMRGGVPGWKGTTGGLIHYSIPFGYWLLSANGSKNFYDQTVAGWQQNYLYSGKIRSADLTLSRVLYRDGSRKISGFLGPWFKTAETFINGHPLPIQYRRTAGFEAGLGYQHFIGRTALEIKATYRWGTGMMGAIPSPDERFYPGISRPKFIVAESHLAMPFSFGATQLRYLNTVRAQWNFTRLSIQDRFSIGPRSTVRGFDGEHILIGEHGWFTRNDIGCFLGNTGQEAYVGVDYGQVGGPSARDLVGRTLAGGVLGMRGRIRQLSYDGFLGVPLRKPKYLNTAPTIFAFNLNMVF